MRMREINVPFITSSIAGFFIMGAALSGAVFQNPNLNIAESISENIKDISGILIAAIAAFIAFFNSIRQGSITIQMKKDDLEREQFAARATLALTLSEICEYSQSCLRYLTFHLESDKAEAEALPKLSDNVITIIRDNIKYAEEKQRSSLMKISEEIQVQIARLPKYDDDFNNFDIHYASHIHDIIRLYTNASNLFSYARTDGIKHTMTIDSAYRINRRYISNNPELGLRISNSCGFDDE